MVRLCVGCTCNSCYARFICIISPSIIQDVELLSSSHTRCSSVLLLHVQHTHTHTSIVRVGQTNDLTY